MRAEDNDDDAVFNWADFETVRQLLLTGDHQAMRALLARYPDYLLVNHDRSALQVVGCDGELIAHIPLAPGILAALSD